MRTACPGQRARRWSPAPELAAGAGAQERELAMQRGATRGPRTGRRAPAFHSCRQRSSSGATRPASRACSRCSTPGSTRSAPSSSVSVYARVAHSMPCTVVPQSMRSRVGPPAARAPARLGAGASSGAAAAPPAAHQQARTAADQQRLLHNGDKEVARGGAAEGRQVRGVRRLARGVQRVVQQRCGAQVLRRAARGAVGLGARCRGCRRREVVRAARAWAPSPSIVSRSAECAASVVSARGGSGCGALVSHRNTADMPEWYCVSRAAPGAAAPPHASVAPFRDHSATTCSARRPLGRSPRRPACARRGRGGAPVAGRARTRRAERRSQSAPPWPGCSPPGPPTTWPGRRPGRICRAARTCARTDAVEGLGAGRREAASCWQAAGHSACATHRSAASRTAVLRSGPSSTENAFVNRPQSACRTSWRPSLRPNAGWRATCGPRHTMRLARLTSSATAVSVSSPTTLASRRVTPAACCRAQRATSSSRSARSGCTRSAGRRGHVAAAASAGARASTLLTCAAACAVVLAGGFARAHIACLCPTGSDQRGRRL